jgi:hypothetical protein
VSGALELAIRSAMEYDSPDSRIEALKTTIANLLRAGDPSTRIRSTEYFNHSFAPDLVLTWPSDGRERLVFLRPNPDPRWLADDLKVIAPSHPIVLSLDPSALQHEEDAYSSLGSAARENHTLVTDPDAIGEFTTPRAPVASVLANAVMRGGIGLVNESFAQQVTQSAVQGFVGASNLDTESTQSALFAAESILDGEQAGRLTRLYQAVWEGHGGTAEQFPSGLQKAGPLNSRDLPLLLRAVTTDDSAFWRRIGRNIRLEQILALGATSGQRSLDMLVEANLDRLLARSVRVFGRSTQEGSTERASWSINDGCLILQGGGWLAYFAVRIHDLPSFQLRSGVRVEILIQGVRDLGVRLADVKIQQAEFAISIASVAEADVIESPDFEQLAARGDAIARSAAVAMSNGRNLIADFVTGTATGHTNATFALDELGPAAIKLLLDLPGGESAELAAQLVPAADPLEVQPLLPLWDE